MVSIQGYPGGYPNPIVGAINFNGTQFMQINIYSRLTTPALLDPQASQAAKEIKVYQEEMDFLEAMVSRDRLDMFLSYL